MVSLHGDLLRWLRFGKWYLMFRAEHRPPLPRCDPPHAFQLRLFPVKEGNSSN